MRLAGTEGLRGRNALPDSKLVERIFSLDGGVRYAAVFSVAGRKMAGGMREGLPSLEPVAKARQVDEKTVRYFSYLVSMKEYLGDARYILLKFERTDVVVVPLVRKVVMVGTAPGVLSHLLDRILAVLEEAKARKLGRSG